MKTRQEIIDIITSALKNELINTNVPFKKNKIITDVRVNIQKSFLPYPSDYAFSDTGYHLNILTIEVNCKGDKPGKWVKYIYK